MQHAVILFICNRPGFWMKGFIFGINFRVLLLPKVISLRWGARIAYSTVYAIKQLSFNVLSIHRKLICVILTSMVGLLLVLQSPSQHLTYSATKSRTCQSFNLAFVVQYNASDKSTVLLYNAAEKCMIWPAGKVLRSELSTDILSGL